MKYLHLRAWAEYAGAFSYQVADRIRAAHAEKAPVDVVYFDVRSNRWVTIQDVKNEQTRQIIEAIVTRLKKPKGVHNENEAVTAAVAPGLTASRHAV